MTEFSGTLRRPAAIGLLLAGYAVFLFAAIGWTPLWLDEIQQCGARAIAYSSLLRWVQLNPGASPLPYLVQRAVVNTLGFSATSARIPTALCGVLAAFSFLALARRSAARNPLIAVLFFAIMPLQLRYSTEARGYSQGLVFSITSWLLFRRCIEKPSLSRSLIYSASILAGLYSHPYTIFPVLAQIVYLFLHRARVKYRWRMVAAAAVAICFYLPWCVLQRETQIRDGSVHFYFFSPRQVFPFALVHELTGGGYVCTICIAALAAAAAAHRKRPLADLAILTAVFSIAGPLLFDAGFSYFFAARQLLFAVPALALLASDGVEMLADRGWGAVAGALALAFLTSAALKDWRQVTVPKDDLAAVARQAGAMLDPRTCVAAAPRREIGYYVFLQPALAQHVCGDRPSADAVILAISQYATAEQKDEVRRDLAASGYALKSARAVGAGAIDVYDRE
ncbi:MAG TPA: glycosyltransferase family 39 protein [Bryobacteraceae bacterium]|jgi:4-amino-4-deoxy-L-arabinose transferase-like glycosyltransferase|nr:glycosyltransferase family 39 protein [Bryobacteraceae bacterium]